MSDFTSNENEAQQFMVSLFNRTAQRLVDVLNENNALNNKIQGLSQYVDDLQTTIDNLEKDNEKLIRELGVAQASLRGDYTDDEIEEDDDRDDAVDESYDDYGWVDCHKSNTDVDEELKEDVRSCINMINGTIFAICDTLADIKKKVGI